MQAQLHGRRFLPCITLRLESRRKVANRLRLSWQLLGCPHSIVTRPFTGSTWHAMARGQTLKAAKQALLHITFTLPGFEQPK